MVGFAQVAGTIGGRGGDVVQISTLQDLIQYVSDSTPRVLMITTNIRASTLTKVQMGSYKSIVGSNGNVTLYNIYLGVNPSSQNIIFQNLIFQHSENNKGNNDIQLYLNYGTAYWIDQCSFVGHKWSPDDGSLDKLLYIGEQASGATISNCYFANHRYGLIFGYPNDDANLAGGDDTRVTICNNRFENLGDRAPGLFRFGQYHVFNNYINNYGLGFTVASKGEVISEYNYFGSSPKTNAMLDDKGSGQFIDTGSVPPILNQKSPKPDWSPTYNYNLKTTDPGTLKTVKNLQQRMIPPKFSTLVVPPPRQFIPPSHFPGLH